MAELYRPRFHFTPPQMWMNDPNGFFFDGKTYHLYYQHNPEARVWGPMHWGAAESGDLLRWTHRGIVMAPDAIGTIFSGSAVTVPAGRTPLLPQGGVAYFFTHHGEDGTECQSLATSTDGGRTLVKYPGNPIIPNDGLRDFRDPKVFWYAPLARWVMIVAGGPVRIYHSEDLLHWTMTQQLDAIVTECPDLFPLTLEGETFWVLSAAGAFYYLGKFDGYRYEPLEDPLPVDAGKSFYAAQSCSGPAERTLWIGWMVGGSQAPTEPWRCAMSLPRELSLVRTARGLRLRQTPIRELERLWGPARTAVLDAGAWTRLPVDSHSLDMTLTLSEGAAAEVTLFVTPRQTCTLQMDGRQLTVNGKTMPLVGGTVRLLADQSTLEIFGPEDAVMTTEVYNGPGPHRPPEVRCLRGRVAVTVHALRAE